MILAPWVQTFWSFRCSAFLRIFYRSHSGQGGPIWKKFTSGQSVFDRSMIYYKYSHFQLLNQKYPKIAEKLKNENYFMGHPVASLCILGCVLEKNLCWNKVIYRGVHCGRCFFLTFFRIFALLWENLAPLNVGKNVSGGGAKKSHTLRAYQNFSFWIFAPPGENTVHAPAHEGLISMAPTWP